MGLLSPQTTENFRELNVRQQSGMLLKSCSDHIHALILTPTRLLITMLSRPAIIFVLGPPGSGKGTQCELLARKFKMHHLSAGELLRQEMETDSPYGQIISRDIKEGRIVPVKITLNLLKDKMKEIGWNQWFLIDGFPRNLDNLTGWNEVMSDIVDIKRILYVNTSQDTCINRILKRAEFSNRTDDNVESLKKRFRIYHDSTLPIIEHFVKLDLVSDISGEDKPEEVFENIQKSFKESLNLVSE